MSENLSIWNKVSKSDDRYLKKVSIGARSFTSIDPQYQIRSATEAFGPVGKGWSYDVEYKYITHGDVTMCVAEITIIYWESGEYHKYGPGAGCRTFIHMNQPKRGTVINEDAPKMALTDGLTKGLSHLGFNADVFLGEHDNKYAAKAKAEGDWDV